jgi:hypothetical protein
MHSHNELLTGWVSKRRTICEILREINDIVGEMPENKMLIGLITEAFGMAKKMDRKLREYKDDWDKGLYTKNEDYQQDLINRGKRGENEGVSIGSPR